MASVMISQGNLKGSKVQTQNGFDYYEFLGVPYAKPPIGNLRFTSPQLPKQWTGERDATNFDLYNISCQHDFMRGQFVGSEDCLYLNVYTPNVASGELKPVMVIIHGGGFIGCSGIGKNQLGPDYLVERDVVIVAINYRLSILGFLNLGIPEASGNMGLKDQVKALEWVHKNIEEFGGDKNNVTIIGASAGSASVEYLVVSPLARGLFHKAILESGSTLNHWALNHDHDTILAEVVQELDYQGSLEDKYAVLDFLKEVGGEDLTKAASKVVMGSPIRRLLFGFVPSIEKDFGNGEAFLTEHPYKTIKDGNFNRVPMIRGFCDSEGQLTMFFKTATFKELVESKNFIGLWPQELSEDYNEKLLEAYSKISGFADEEDQFAVDFFTDFDFGAGVWISGKMMAKTGVPIYAYLFTYDGKGSMTKTMFNSKRKGAGHCDEMGYLITSEIVKSLDDDDIAMKDKLTKMWTDFAKTGNPTPTDSNQPVKWPRFTLDTPAYLNIGKELTIQQDYEPIKMAIFEDLYAE